jgi:DNA-binding transcriptional MerR regulator
MSTHTGTDRTYTILEAAKLSGLPESTLRYYETIGIIDAIQRDSSSKHRAYSDENINLVVAVACLSATGMSIGAMRAYLSNRGRGAQAAGEQIVLLETQKERLNQETYYLQLRRRYVDTKIDYWKAVELGDQEQVKAIKERADDIAKELRSPREKQSN